MRLALKELREILRDRRTITTLVLMPLLLYPLLGVMVKRGLLSSLESTGATAFRVVVESAEAIEQLSRQLEEGEALLPQESVDDSANPLAELAAAAGEKQPALKIYQLEDGFPLETVVRSRQADIGVRLTASDQKGADNGPSFQWMLVHRDNSQLSDNARSYIVRRLEAVNEQYVLDTLTEHSIDLHLPAVITERTIAVETKQQSPFITFVPLVLVLMTMTGAVYPAIDLTAGERERGTMEILIAAPISRMTLLAGKFLAVLVVALLTACVNMLAMITTLFTLGLDGAVLGGNALRLMPLVVLMTVVFAGFFSAVLLSITSVARSFKEAQAYLIPLMLISLTPGVFSLMPDLQMGPLLAITPLVNIVLAGRDLLQGDFNLLMFGIVILSTACYGVLALTLAARVFGSDSVLYGSSSSWTALLKPPDERLATAAPATAMLALAIVFPLFLVVGTIPSRLGQMFALALPQVLLLNIFVFLIVFVAVPLLIIRLSNVSMSSALSLNTRVPFAALVAALLFGISLWPVLYELNLVVGIASRAESLQRMLETLVDDLEKTPLIIKLTALAFAPALCEELFFRGFLQTSLRQRYSATITIAATAILFGLFHIVVRDSLFLERMIPSTLMGIILGTMLERSGSVFPGMLLHAVHNGLLLCVVHYKTQLEQLGIGLEQRSHLPPIWLAGGIGLAILGGLILCRTRPVSS